MTHTLLIERHYLAAVVSAIRAATTEILACCYEWGWYEGQRTGTVQDINRALCQAAERGVTVNVLLHREAPRRPLYNINNKTVRNLHRHHIDARFALSSHVLHAKFWVFDSAVAIVGSHNISTRATTSNAEVSVLLDHPPSALDLRRYFFSLYSPSPVI